MAHTRTIEAIKTRFLRAEEPDTKRLAAGCVGVCVCMNDLHYMRHRLPFLPMKQDVCRERGLTNLSKAFSDELESEAEAVFPPR